MIVPNLDAMTEEDLRTLGYGLMKLSRFAITRAHAMRHRRAGRTKQALAAEAYLEILRRELPANMKW